MLKEEFSPMKATYTGSEARRGEKKGILTIIASKRNGYRIVIPMDLATELQLEGTVQMGFQRQELILGKTLPNTTASFPLKRISNTKLAIYSASAVREIIEKSGVTFTNKVSYTFYELEFDELDGVPVAVIGKGGAS